MKQLLPALIVLFSLAAGRSQEYRAIDGRGNNLQNPDWGAVNAHLLFNTTNGYADKMAAPAGANRPNPRIVSNTLFAQDTFVFDRMALSDYCWAFGQFIDHERTLVKDSREPMMIPVPTGDKWMDPQKSGRVMIPMFRSAFDPATGTSPDNPRLHVNVLTAYIVVSAVYG